MPAKKAVKQTKAAKLPYEAETFAEMVGEKRNALHTIASRLYPEQNGGGKDSNVGTLDYIAGEFSPFCGSSNGISIAKLIRLSKLCFYNNQSYRNAILNQVFLSNTKLLMQGDPEQIGFFETWFEKMNMWNFCNWFFTEWFRSGNVFIWRYTGSYSLGEMRENMRGIRQTTAKNRTIPTAYTIIDPESVNSLGAASFVNQKYGKLIGAYELERLKNPSTPEEKEFIKNLSPADREAIKKGINPLITLNPENLIAIFNNKQPYEPLAVPTYSPILKSINLKTCMRQADLLLMETIDMVVFFVTVGVEGGDNGPTNEKLIKALTGLLQSRGAGKAIITHYSAKADFILPDLRKIMSSDRYEALDREIAAGLMDLFSMEDSYASSYTKTKIYLELLQQGRDAFLSQFLVPEMKRIAKELGWETIPSVQFEEISLESETEKLKIFVRLYEMGQLTAEGLEQAFKNGELPLNSINEEQQKNFKKLKDGGAFQPIAANMGNDGGRPTGTPAKQSKKTVRPAGAEVQAESLATLDGIQKGIQQMNQLFNLTEEIYKKDNGISRLSRKAKAVCDQVSTNVAAMEESDKWTEATVKNYLKNPFAVVMNSRRQEVLEIAEEFEVPTLSAVILHEGRKNSQPEQ